MPTLAPSTLSALPRFFSPLYLDLLRHLPIIFPFLYFLYFQELIPRQVLHFLKTRVSACGLDSPLSRPRSDVRHLHAILEPVEAPCDFTPPDLG